MKFNLEFSEKWLDSTEVDAIRALRPDGPLDSTWYQTRCLKCGQEANQPLRWFHECDFVCACGGEFDTEPLRKSIADQTVKYLFRTKSFDKIRQLLEPSDSGGGKS